MSEDPSGAPPDAQDSSNGATATTTSAPPRMEEDPETPTSRRRQSLRNSRASISLYGPPTSSRAGRPERLSSILCQRGTTNEASFLGLVGSSGMNVDDDDGDDDDLETGEAEQENGTILPPQMPPAATTDESMHIPTASQRRRFLRRVSAQVDAASQVCVTLRDVSYHVPVPLDAPTKATVVNQSICYETYEFFCRLRNYLSPPRSTTTTTGTTSFPEKYRVNQISDMFVPFSKKTILHQVHLIFVPGQSYLVLGPPGSGKTTLLRAIAGRLPHFVGVSAVMDPKKNNNPSHKRHAHLTGRIEYNGVVDPNLQQQHEDNTSTNSTTSGLMLANVVSFVGQLDVHAPYLTVQETFNFAAACRTSSNHHDATTTTQRRNENENNTVPPSSAHNNTNNLTLQGLGLAHVQDTFVGNANVRGVSGGQRRRVTIGEMMQGDAPVVCADEVSTGLDAAVTYVWSSSSSSSSPCSSFMCVWHSLTRCLVCLCFLFLVIATTFVVPWSVTPRPP